MVHFPDTIRQLESVASVALVPQEDVDVLVAAYQRYRLAAHRRALESRARFQLEFDQAVEIDQRLLGPTPAGVSGAAPAPR